MTVAILWREHNSLLSMCKILAELEQMVYVLVWDKNELRWAVRECSPACKHIYGHSREEMKARSFNIIEHIHPDDAKRIEQVTATTVPTGFNFVVEKRIRGRDVVDPYKWVRSKAVLLSQDEVEQVWLGMFDDISDFKTLCVELDRSRSCISAMEEAVRRCFDQSFYLDDNQTVYNSYWNFPKQGESDSNFLSMIPSDVARFTQFVIEPLSRAGNRRPVMVDLNFSLKSGKTEVFHVLAARVPCLGGDSRILIGLRPNAAKSTAVARSLIDVEITGDIETTAGFVFASLPQHAREKFASMWKSQECLYELVECFGQTAQSFCGLVHLIVLSLISNRVPVLDKVGLLTRCLERSLSLLSGPRCAEVIFRLCLCALKLSEVSLTSAAFFFDQAMDALFRNPHATSSRNMAVLFLQRGVHFHRANRGTEALMCFDRILPFTTSSADGCLVQIKSLALFNAAVLKPQKARQLALLNHILAYEHDVDFDVRVLATLE